ncbi:hypothetical protein GI582_22840 [Sulfitobacter sp. BDSS02]|nr:hypothetical protein [Sulfitobacter sp. BDSS02]
MKHYKDLSGEAAPERKREPINKKENVVNAISDFFGDRKYRWPKAGDPEVVRNEQTGEFFPAIVGDLEPIGLENGHPCKTYRKAYRQAKRLIRQQRCR